MHRVGSVGTSRADGVVARIPCLRTKRAVRLTICCLQAIGLASKLHELHSSLSVDQNYLARISTQERQPQWEEGMLNARSTDRPRVLCSSLTPMLLRCVRGRSHAGRRQVTPAEHDALIALLTPCSFGEASGRRRRLVVRSSARPGTDAALALNVR